MEEPFVGYAPFELLVPETIGQEARPAELFAEVLGGVDAQARLEAFESIVAYDLHVWAYTYGAYVPVLVDKRIDGIVHRLVKRYVLDLVHHLVDVRFLLGELVRAGLRPIRIVFVVGFREHFHLSVRHGHLFYRAEIDLGVVELPHADHGHHTGRVAKGDGKVGVEFVLGIEPGGIGKSLIVRLQHYITEPVHIASAHHLGLYALEGEFLGVYTHLAVECGGRYAGLGMVTHHIGFASVHLQRIHYEVVVVQQASVLYGRREFHVEAVDEGLVEVGPKVHAAGELAEQVVLWVDSGDAVGEHGFVVLFGIARVPAFHHRFGYHGRKIRYAAHD